MTLIAQANATLVISKKRCCKRLDFYNLATEALLYHTFFAVGYGSRMYFSSNNPVFWFSNSCAEYHYYYSNLHYRISCNQTFGCLNNYNNEENYKIPVKTQETKKYRNG